MKSRRVSSQVECQPYDNILGTQNVSISPNTSVFIKNGIVCVNTRHGINELLCDVN